MSTNPNTQASAFRRPDGEHRRGDLDGMQFCILARLSDESKRRKRKKDQAERPKRGPVTGMDIDTRARQVTRATRQLEARGATVVYVYDEPHTSAWKRKRVIDPDGTVRYEVIRPVYRQALKDLKRGIAPNGERMDGLFAVDIDRITRDNRDLEDAIDAVTHSGRPILEMTGTLDLMSNNGRTQARIMVAFKGGQSSDTSQRVTIMHEALQEYGIPTGGQRPFGWNEDKRTLNENEATLLREAINGLLAGRTSRSAIASDWNRKGVTTVRGSKWHTSVLTTMLRNPRLCGYRMITVSRDKGGTGYPMVKYGADGKPVIGQWDPIITPEQWTALQERIGESFAVGSGHNTRKHLATGTLRCGKCDRLMVARKAIRAKKRAEGHYLYVCPPVSQGGCSGVGISGPEVDEALTELVLASWEEQAKGRSLKQTPREWSGQAKLDRVYEDLAELKKRRNAEPPRISTERYYQELEELEAKESALIRERNKVVKKAAVADVPVNLRTDWDAGELTLEQKRDFIVQVLSSVIVLPANGRRNVPVQERMVPVAAKGRNGEA